MSIIQIRVSREQKILFEVCLNGIDNLHGTQCYDCNAHQERLNDLSHLRSSGPPDTGHTLSIPVQ